MSEKKEYMEPSVVRYEEKFDDVTMQPPPPLGSPPTDS